jgi:multiple sugar transport system substrate-binding protein
LAELVGRRGFPRRGGLRGAGGLAAASGPWAAGCDQDEGDALSFFFQANPEEARGRMRVIAEFARLHPDIPVRPVLSGPDPMQQMSTYCSGGKCPDVLMTWELTYAGLADRGVLLDLNTMPAGERAVTGSPPPDGATALSDTFSWLGGRYAVPEQWSGNFLFYNRKLFADAGVPAPPGRWDRPWSFDEFLHAAKELTKRDGDGTQWGFVDTWVPYYSAGVFGRNNGVPWCVPRMNPTHINFDHDAFLAGIQFYADLANRHGVAPTPADQQSMSTTDLFAGGKAAMAMGGHWRYQTFAQADGLDFDLAVLPTGPRGVRAKSNIGTTGLAIAAGSRRKEQAWKFVTFLTGPAGQAITAASGLFVPVLRTALDAPEFARAHARLGNLAVLADGPAESDYLPVTPAWEKVDALMDRCFGAVLRGGKPADWLRTALSPAVDRVLANP